MLSGLEMDQLAKIKVIGIGGGGGGVGVGGQVVVWDFRGEESNSHGDGKANVSISQFSHSVMSNSL